jgi:hypothetical protein
MLRILVDNSVIADEHVGRFCSEPSPVDWGGRATTVSVAKFRIDLPSDGSKRRQILALPTIARLSQEEALWLATYPELKWEDMFGRRPATATRGDLLGSIQLHSVEPAIDRSNFGGLTFPQGMEGEELTSFCKLILDPRFEPALFPSEFVAALPDTTRKAMDDLSRFRRLCRHAPEKHYRDLFHLWTGECSGCKFFITMESKLPNFCSSHVKDLVCMPKRPAELLDELGITQVDPLPFREGESIDFFRAIEGQ